jgi:hypothetical protein
VAEAAARLPAAHQEQLERELVDRGRLTLAQVRDVVRDQTSTNARELPDGLFADQGVPWQVTVRGHLTAALAVIPAGTGRNPLRVAIAEALERSEQL